MDHVPTKIIVKRFIYIVGFAAVAQGAFSILT